MSIIKKIVNLIFFVLGILTIWKVFGLQFAWAEFYYFGSPAGLLVFAILIIFIGGLFIWGLIASKKQQHIDQKPISGIQKFSQIIIQLIVSGIMIFILLQHKGQLIKYDLIYAYGPENALSQINIVDKKIQFGQDTNFVVYYYNFRRNTTQSDSHEIPKDLLNRLNIVSSTNNSPEGQQTDTKITNSHCSINVTNHIISGYEGMPKYSDCKVIGWIKRLW